MNPVHSATRSPLDAPPTEPVVVLGAGRSGTSTVAGILRILGVDMGATDWAGQDVHNVRGYVEDRAFLELNDRVLKAAGGSWSEPPTEADILATAKALDVAREVRNLADERDGLWGWKDPRTALTIESFVGALGRPRFVVCTRNPLHAAASLRARDGFALEDCLGITVEYQRRVIAFLARHPDLSRVFIAYEDVLEDPVREAAALAEFIGVEFEDDHRAQVRELVVARDEIVAFKEQRAQERLDEIESSRAWRVMVRLRSFKHRIPGLRGI